MTPETVFAIANMSALLGWLVLAAGIALNRPLLRDTLAGLWIPIALAGAYTILILVFWWSAEGGFDTLVHVQTLFTSPWIALGGWVHYLCFDLFVGALLSRRIMAAKFSRLWLIPILPLAFLFGPIGFVLAQVLLFTRKGTV